MKTLFRNIIIVIGFVYATTSFAANPIVDIKTNMGTMTVELYSDKAPKTVDNFVQYAKEGFYKGTIFHRVIPGFMVQGGGLTREFKEKDTRGGIRNEASNGLSNARGTIAMARTSDPNSATAQFFINLVDNTPLNYSSPTVHGAGYAVFGKVIKGMDVVDKIAAIPTGPGGPFPTDVPTKPVIIEDIVVTSPSKP